MKKWIFVVVLYGLGALFLYDCVNGLKWIGEQFNTLVDLNAGNVYYYYLIFLMLPVLLVLMNYFILRIRAKNPAFTFINAMFVTIFIVLLMINKSVGDLQGFKSVFEGMVDVETWKVLWRVYPGIFVALGLNFISGIVISEAKSKGTYLTAEFVYLLTGIITGFIAGNMFL